MAITKHALTPAGELEFPLPFLAPAPPAELELPDIALAEEDPLARRRRLMRELAELPAKKAAELAELTPGWEARVAYLDEHERQLRDGQLVRDERSVFHARYSEQRGSLQREIDKLTDPCFRMALEQVETQVNLFRKTPEIVAACEQAKLDIERLKNDPAADPKEGCSAILARLSAIAMQFANSADVTRDHRRDMYIPQNNKQEGIRTPLEFIR